MGKVKLNRRITARITQRSAIAICYCTDAPVPPPTDPEEREAIRTLAELCVAGYRWVAAQPGSVQKPGDIDAFRALMPDYLDRIACRGLVCVFCGTRGYIPGAEKDKDHPYVLFIGAESSTIPMLHALRIPVGADTMLGIDGVYASALRPVVGTLGTHGVGGDDG